MKTEYLQDRAAVVGEKLAAYLQAGKIPSQADVAFFDKCIAELCTQSPAHALRLLALDLHKVIEAERAKRALWLKGRAEAFKLADQRKATRKATRIRQGLAFKRTKIVRQVIAELADRAVVPAVSSVPVAPPVGTSKQGLPFVIELPLEWQSDKVEAA